MNKQTTRKKAFFNFSFRLAVLLLVLGALNAESLVTVDPTVFRADMNNPAANTSEYTESFPLLAMKEGFKLLPNFSFMIVRPFNQGVTASITQG